MSGRPIGCVVLIDGVEISDGCSDLSPDAPAILSGLRIIWGRSSQVDQATASTCTFNVDDPLDGDRLIPTLTIGRQIDVRTDTTIYPDPDTSVLTGLFPSALKGVWSAAVHGDTVELIVDGSGQAATMTLPPMPFTADQLGWDSVPRSLPGQAWSFDVTVTFPAPFAGWSSWAAQVAPVAFTAPDGSDARVLDYVDADPRATASFVPPPGVWLGLQVRAWPVGPRWIDLDATAWTGLGAAPSWQDLGTFEVSDVELLAPSGGASESALVFSGRITDISTRWDGGDTTTVNVIAQDWLAELANRYVGDTPWPLEALSQRATRIVNASGQPVNLSVDPVVGGLQVTYRDVDRQAAAGLLQQLATSAGGILWAATHLVTGQVLWLEDVGARPAARTLSDDGGQVHVIPSSAALDHALPITACDIEASPVRFALDMTDTISMVSLSWLEQVVDDGVVKPANRTIEVYDPGAVAAIGARRLSVSTQLSYEPQALAQANGWLARSSVMAWRIEGLSWDTDGDLGPDQIDTIMTLLDGTRRIGLPIALTDLPAWSLPVVGGMDIVGLYVEGGTYTYEGGAWLLELNTSSATGSAVGSFPWTASEPEWSWDTYRADVQWLDLYGVTYPDV